MVAKTAKTPGFPTKTGTQGVFCSIQPIPIHLQLFASVLVDQGGGSPPEGKKPME
jgi:hypothetical protein